MSKKLALGAVDLPNKEKRLGLTNCAYLNPADFGLLFNNPKEGQLSYLQIKDFVFTAESNNGTVKDTVGLSLQQRNMLSLALNEKIDVVAFIPDSDNYLEMVKLEVDLLVKKQTAEEFNVQTIIESIKNSMTNYYLTIGQIFLTSCTNNAIFCKVMDLSVIGVEEMKRLMKSNNNKEPKEPKAHKANVNLDNRGKLMSNTVFIINSNSIKLVGDEGPQGYRSPFKEFPKKIEELDIGGLDKQFCDIFRRAFVMRLFPPSTLAKLNMKHAKGILLYGPPGCGKTLLARQIGKMLAGKEPTIVNGPEIFNKYVGEAEARVRTLFAEAEKEYKQKGDNSSLHVIVFDEFDAIARPRGSHSDGTGVADNVVNQLLACVDGVKQINNILLIGMTNRKDLIDEALLRPGRFEIQIEIGLPDEKGRLQILKIHTQKLQTFGALEDDVNLDRLSKLTKNFTGAELEGLVRDATTFAFNRLVDVDTMQVQDADISNIKIGWNDFVHALDEVRPTFGVNDDAFNSSVRNGIINYGSSFENLMGEGKMHIEQVRSSDVTPLVSLLLHGPQGCGKTAAAGTLALTSQFPFIKMISPETMVGMHPALKIQQINQTFINAYKSTSSVIMIDDLERLIDYAPIGPQYSNSMLQALLLLLKRTPPPGHKLFIICTTSALDVLQALSVTDLFDNILEIPTLTTQDEFNRVLTASHVFDESNIETASGLFKGLSVPIKKMLSFSEAVKLTQDKEEKKKRLETILRQYRSLQQRANVRDPMKLSFN